MSMTYYKTFKVPMWVVVEDNLPAEVSAKAKQYFKDRDALIQDWPSNTFGKAVLGYVNKGWAHIVGNGFPFNLSPQLLMMAASAHLKDTISQRSNLGSAINLPAHRLNRNVTSQDDINRLLDDILSMEDETSLSQIFQVAERCHNENSKRAKVFVTFGGAPKNVLNKISNSVISIGGSSSDLDLSGVEADKIEETLDNFFINRIK